MLTTRLYLLVVVLFATLLGIIPADSFAQTIPTRTPTPGSPTRTPRPTRTPQGYVPTIQDVTSLGSTDIGRAVFVADKVAYVAEENGRFKTIDLSDPDNPAEIGNTLLPTSKVKAVHVADDTVYLAQGETGLTTIDTADPANPILLNTYNVGGDVDGVYVADDVAYLIVRNIPPTLDRNGVYTVDVSNPAAPYSLDFYNMTTLGMLGNISSNISVVDERAYILRYFQGLVVLDVSNPRNITHEHTYFGVYGGDVAIVDEFMYTLDFHPYGRVFVFDTGDNSQLEVYDGEDWGLSDPRTIHIENSIAYIADRDEGLFLFDVSRPPAMTLLGTYSQADGYNLFVEDQLVYMVESDVPQNQLHILQHRSLEPTHIGIAPKRATQPYQPLTIALITMFILTISLHFRTKRGLTGV